MIQIGFCDDDPSVLDELHELLGSYRAEHNADIAPTAFQSPFELLASIERAHALIFCCSMYSCPAKTASKPPVRSVSTTPT